MRRQKSRLLLCPVHPARQFRCRGRDAGDIPAGLEERAHLPPQRQNALAWILGITKYTALARLREGQRAGIPLEDAADKVDPRDAFRDCENRIVTQAILAQLAQDEREIVVLHVVTGLKHREIAELLEMPLPTVLSKYRRSLKKLERLVREPS